MHARLDQLLSLRDGAPVDAVVRNHVQQCAACLAQSARLALTRDHLRSLPPLDPPAHAWAQIAARAAEPPRRRVGLGFAAAAACLVLGVIAFIGVRDERSDPDSFANVRKSTVIASDELQRLMEQSRQLEAVLDYLPQRPQVERVSMAATVDSIEERIQWLDWQLADGSDAELDQRQAQRLWSERVDLMDSLVKVRYAQSAPTVF